MKKTTLIASAVAVMAALSLTSCNENKPNTPVGTQKDSTMTSAVAGSIVFFNMDRVMAEYDMANDLRAVAETKINSIQAEITRRENKLTRAINEYQDKVEKGLLTRSVAEEQQRKIQQQQQSYQNFVLEKQQEMAEEQQVMVNNIMNGINEYIKKYNEEKQYAFIFATGGDILTTPVVYGDPAFDITDDLLDGLNKEYVANKDKPAKEDEE